MSRVAPNLLANLSGTGWAAVMQLAFIPVYIRFLGIEAWGLVGFYLTLQGMLQVLDFGLSPTMNREMARYSVQPDKAAEARDLVRTLEVGYWFMGLAIACGLLAATPFLATRWIKPGRLPPAVVEQTLFAMSAVVALQWPLSFYQGGLLGLQRQVALAAVQVVMATVRAGGAALVLWLVSPTIVTFFLWYVVTSFVQVAITTILLWRSLPPSNMRPRFRVRLLRNIWRFAAGMSGIGVSALVLTQLDKVLLSRLLSLEAFGYYTLATVVVSGLLVIITPVFNTVFPKLSALAAAGMQTQLAQLYHAATQLMSVLVAPAALMIVLFSLDILRLWTGDATVALHAAPIASILAIGTALNGLMHLPYALQLAHGWTSIGLRINFLLVVLLVPAIIVMSLHFGAVGAAAVWVALNSLYMAVAIPLTHRRLLKGQGVQWFWQDLLLPTVSALAVVSAGRWLFAGPLSVSTALVTLPLIASTAILAAIVSAPRIRAAVFSRGPSLRRIFT